MAGEPVERGTMAIKDGAIAAVGPGVPIPADAARRSVAGMIVMPGIVDTRSHIGQVAGLSGPIQPEAPARWMRSVRLHPISPGPAPKG